MTAGAGTVSCTRCLSPSHYLPLSLSPALLQLFDGVDNLRSASKYATLVSNLSESSTIGDSGVDRGGVGGGSAPCAIKTQRPWGNSARVDFGQ